MVAANKLRVLSSFQDSGGPPPFFFSQYQPCMVELEDKLLFSFISTLGVFTQANEGYRLCLCAIVSTPPSAPNPLHPVSAAPRPLTLQAHHRQLAANFSFVSAAAKKKKKKMWQIFIFAQIGMRGLHTKRALRFQRERTPSLGPLEWEGNWVASDWLVSMCDSV